MASSYLDASLSLGRLLNSASPVRYRVGIIAHGLGLVEKYCLRWHQKSESARQVSLPVTCQTAKVSQPDRLCATCQALHDCIGVTSVERPDPKDLSTFS